MGATEASGLVPTWISFSVALTAAFIDIIQPLLCLVIVTLSTAVTAILGLSFFAKLDFYTFSKDASRRCICRGPTWAECASNTVMILIAIITFHPYGGLVLDRPEDSDCARCSSGVFQSDSAPSINGTPDFSISRFKCSICQRLSHRSHGLRSTTSWRCLRNMVLQNLLQGKPVQRFTSHPRSSFNSATATRSETNYSNTDPVLSCSIRARLKPSMVSST
jgi:hypothetical protein